MTPLYTALKQFADQNPLRMCMPGHKGKLPGSALDFTELTPTGNLYEGGEPFDQAQALWAEVFGFAGCQFLTGGSTQGVHTALALCCAPGDRVLLDRGCHKSAFAALALLDVEPVWMWDLSDLEKHPEIKTVCITSPTYYGKLLDVSEIAQKVHRRGGRLIVDGAHGAHLPFLGVDAFRGADLVVCSAHKTLPALGQSALLFYQNFVSPEQVRRRAALYGSSSPSYLMTASMDWARDWMIRQGVGEYNRVAEKIARWRARYPSLTGRLDPLRLTLTSPDGYRAAAALEQLGIFVEMADRGHLVLILTGLDSDEDLYRLEQSFGKIQLGDPPDLPPLPRPEQVLSQRRALFAPTELLPLEACAGRIAGEPLAPYPPGIPVVAPGERISEKELAYFRKIGYNKEQTGVVIE